MRPVCENCPDPAQTSDESGTALCWSCYAKLAAECAYEDGVADGVNDIAPDLIAAAQAVVASPNADALARLRHALAEIDLERAA
jgi:hypothetical protein